MKQTINCGTWTTSEGRWNAVAVVDTELVGQFIESASKNKGLRATFGGGAFVVELRTAHPMVEGKAVPGANGAGGAS